MEVGQFLHGIKIRSKVLAHRQQTVGSSAAGLDNIPEPLEEIKRVVIRNLTQPMQWRADGGDPTAVEAMYAFANDLVVLDVNDLSLFSMVRAPDATDNVDVRIIYLC